MNSRLKYLLKFLFVWMAVMIIFSLFMYSSSREAYNYFDMLNLDEREEGYFVVKNEEDEREIMKTARILHIGDEYIDVQNRHFRIVRITDDIAWARLISERRATSIPRSVAGGKPGDVKETAPVEARDQRIAVYHSHGAESYVPSDGAESIDEGGGILDVGRSFADALEEQNFNVIHSTKTHVPHDAGAYHRSRRTKEELMKEEPAAFFDIHRDAVPEDEYLEEVEGEERVQVLLVVGRQNQNVANNRQFAEELKAAADEEYPGLVKGILMAQGNYNQDMSVSSMLLEIGGHENQREQAEESAAIFAGVVGNYFGAPGTGERADVAGRQRSTITGEGGIAATTALWLIIIVGAAAFGFLLISSGSWEEAKSRLKHFFNKEFADVFGRKKE